MVRMALRLAMLIFLPLFSATALAQLFLEDPTLPNDNVNDPFIGLSPSQSEASEEIPFGTAAVQGKGSGVGNRVGGKRQIGGNLKKPSQQENGFKGRWELVNVNAGVSAMHLQLMPNNEAIMFDATVFGPSEIKFPAGKSCRPVIRNNVKQEDCWAHAVAFDIQTSKVRTLKVMTDTWCSSGGLSADGTLVQTGGWGDGTRAVRYLSPCNTCEWVEHPTALSVPRWYSTQQILPDGSFILFGGRRQFNFEFIPRPGMSNQGNFMFPFLRETTDQVEDNLYPFVHLSTDGNLFILANNRSVLFNPTTKAIIREFPVLPGGARNYPGSGFSALLPLRLRGDKVKVINAEVLVCGGSPHGSPQLAAVGKFIPALRTCGRITITQPNPIWRLELMPTPRVMSDMLLLPNADVLIINGAKNGCAGWGFASEPALEPILYKPKGPRNQRFTLLSPTTIPRMYHSSSAVLPDGRILVAGSNTNNGYNFTGVPFPTELRVEKFSPPYLDPLLGPRRPKIVGPTPKTINYRQFFKVTVNSLDVLQFTDATVTMYSPPFTTHGISMNQRLLILRVNEVVKVGLNNYDITVIAPPTTVIAPAGYYLLFVVHRGMPSEGVWIQIH